MRAFLCTTILTGVKASRARHNAEWLDKLPIVHLIRRPDNSFDSEAISVHIGREVTSDFIGWIPANTDHAKGRKEIINAILKSKDFTIEDVVLQADTEAHFIEVGLTLVA